MSMELRELLIQYEIANGLNHSEMAAKAGVSLSTYYRWINGESIKLKRNTINRLTELLSCDIESVIEESSRIKPILGKVKAGYDMYADEDVEGYIELGQADSKRGDYFLRVKGDSMEGSHIYDGDLIYVRCQSEVQSGSLAVVMIGDEVTVKKVKYKNDLMILEASNPKYEARYFTAEEIIDQQVKVIGLVRFVRTDFA